MTTRFDEDDSSEVARASPFVLLLTVNVGRAVIAYRVALLIVAAHGEACGKNGPKIGGRRLRAGFAPQRIEHGSNAPGIK